jgi:hypothetical protein
VVLISTFADRVDVLMLRQKEHIIDLALQAKLKQPPLEFPRVTVTGATQICNVELHGLLVRLRKFFCLSRC